MPIEYESNHINTNECLHRYSTTIGLCLGICMCMCSFLYVYVYMFTYMHLDMDMHMDLCIWRWKCISPCTWICMCMRNSLSTVYVKCRMYNVYCLQIFLCMCYKLHI